MSVIVNPPAARNRERSQMPARLGFAVFFEEDGVVSEELLRGLKAAGYDGIEPNCFQVQHLERVIAACQNVGLAIHAIPTGRWMDVDDATKDYRRYTQRALDVLSAGATVAAALDAPLILGLVRGRSTVPDGAAAAFLGAVVGGLVQRTPQLKLLVEPIAPGEAAWPHSIPQGAQLLKTLNAPNAKLLADSYHIARSGENVAIDQYGGSIGHLHIRDHQKLIPTQSAPEYASILRLWRAGSRVLSFEPNLALRDTLVGADVGVEWLNHELAHA